MGEHIKYSTNHVINHLFADQYHYDGDNNLDTRILLVQYNKEDLRYQKITTEPDSYKEYCNPDCINWFNITGLTDTRIVQKILKDFDCYSVDAKPILTPCHAAKIDDFNGRLIIVIRPCFLNKKNDIHSEHICILAKDNVVLTFRELGNVSLNNVMKALRTNLMDIRTEDEGMLIAFILNAILSVMIGTAIKVEEMLENIDKMLMDAENSDPHISKKIQSCSYANLFLQKNSVPLKDEFEKLMQLPMVKEDDALVPVYSELYNQLDYVLLTSRNCTSLLTSLRDLYVSNNDLKANTIMKRLTVVATLFIPITFWVGLWGMNFEFMPELSLKYGYLIAWIVLITTTLITWLYMKRHKWF